MTLLKLLNISEFQFPYLLNKDHHDKPEGLLKEIDLMHAIWFGFSKR